MSKYLVLEGTGTCYEQKFVCVEIANKIFCNKVKN